MNYDLSGFNWSIDVTKFPLRVFEKLFVEGVKAPTGELKVRKMTVCTGYCPPMHYTITEYPSR
jgi:hypothetical protein